jgi:hypothetical protein
VRHSPSWHEYGGNSVRPEDVIVAAFVQLRRIAVRNFTTDSHWLLNQLCQTATTDLIPSPESLPHSHNDVNYDVVLRNCNSQLSGWMETWSTEMQRGRSPALIENVRKLISRIL